MFCSLCLIMGIICLPLLLHDCLFLAMCFSSFLIDILFFLSAAQSKYTWNKILILKCSWTKPNASSARLFVFTPLDVQFWDSNISDENVKLFCTCSCQIACKPATQEQSWHQISECSLRWKKKTGPVFSCWCCDFRVWNRGGKKKWRAAVWSVCLIYMRNKKAYQFLSLSHPFTRPASTTLLMILCIIQKQFGRLHFRRKKKLSR